MQTGIDCFACFMQQAVNTVKQCTEETESQRRILVRAGEALSNINMVNSPPVNLASFYQIIAEQTNIPDPFAAIKKRENDFVLGLEDTIQKTIAQAPDPLLTAIRFAIGGNVLDSGSPQQIDIESTLAGCQNQQASINHYTQLREKLSESRRILYLTDNCGEIVFDKLVISQLLGMGLDVTVAVRGSAVINDATIEDAAYCGLDKLCPVISNGIDIPGTSVEHCSEEFRENFNKADCIFSKGMGNFECLSEVDGPIFFLLTIKCITVLDYLKRQYASKMLKIGSPVIVDQSFHL
ncbi:damage-control phosphatase ARMT1 family protein [Desulforhopalus sp. 52FAK]